MALAFSLLHIRAAAHFSLFCIYHRDDFLPEARSVLAHLRSTAAKAN